MAWYEYLEDLEKLKKKYVSNQAHIWMWLIYLSPWDPCTLGPLHHGILGPLPSSNTSSYFLLHPLTSSYLLLFLPPTLLLWYGLVWGVGGCWDVTLEIDPIGYGPLTFILMLKSYGWWWVVVGVLMYIIMSALVLFWVMKLRLEMDQDPSFTIWLNSDWTYNSKLSLHSIWKSSAKICLSQKTEF